MWQQVLEEIDSTIDIAYQMAHVTAPMRHSLADGGVRMWELEATRYNEIHIVPLTAENLALHEQVHGRTTWIIPSEDLQTSPDEEWHRGRSMYYVTNSSGSVKTVHKDTRQSDQRRSTNGGRQRQQLQRGRQKTRDKARHEKQRQKQSYNQQLSRYRRQGRPEIRAAR